MTVRSDTGAGRETTSGEHMTTAQTTNQVTTVKLALSGLTKQYSAADEPAVNRLDMDVEEGHLVALLGPSGCGKTTTLQMVAGLLDPTAGSISVDGRDITHTPVHKRGMGMVFQSYALFPHLNVAQNVAFGLEMRKIPKHEQKARVSAALDMVRLGHLSGRRVKALSGGQQQRIALARALVVEPTLLLLDEPLSNLDAKLRVSMRTEIRSIQQRLKATTLFVTHDQDEALDMSDRIAVMNGGLIEQFGSPMEVYERPRTSFVANFIGRANLFETVVGEDVGPAGGDERLYRVAVHGRGGFGAVGMPGLTGSTRMLLVRPHRLRVGLPPDETGGGERLEGVIQELGYTGNALSFGVQVDGNMVRAELNASSARIPQRGEPAHLSWRPDDALILPEDVAKGP
jgi:putative spermidine/putrescine transport system ATP-binding protein